MKEIMENRPLLETKHDLKNHIRRQELILEYLLQKGPASRDPREVVQDLEKTLIETREAWDKMLFLLGLNKN